jgi:hypothetical protein
VLCAWLSCLLWPSPGRPVAGGLLAPSLGISPTGDYGLSLPGTLLCWGGAMTLLALMNLLRNGRPRRTRE